MKHIILEFLTIEEMKKYKHPIAPTSSEKDRMTLSKLRNEKNYHVFLRVEILKLLKILSLSTESSIKDQCKKEPKPIIETSDVQLKDEVEVQIGSYIDFILLSGFHIHKQLRVSIMFATEENDRAKKLLNFYKKAQVSKFYTVRYFKTCG